jgi:Tfp pilus assembly protein PilF
MTLRKIFTKRRLTFEKILELDASQARAYMGLARIYIRQGKFDQAESQLMRAVDLDPEGGQTEAGVGSVLCRPKGIRPGPVPRSTPPSN